MRPILSRRGVGWLCVTLLWMLCIFSFSLQPGNVSNGTSGSFLQQLMDWFLSKPLAPEVYDLIHGIVRKCAHFAEYALLGLLSMCTLYETQIQKRFAAGLSFCAGAACADEIIQLFVSGRAGRITDVLLDSAGAAVGMGAAALLAVWIGRLRKHRKNS